MRGSRKHLLDLLDSEHVEQRLTDLLLGTGVTVAAGAARQPLGHREPSEWTIRRFAAKHLAGQFDYDSFDRWWVGDQYQNPQWDLLVACDIDGRPGLLMVEAKAHECEVSQSGKPLKDAASEQSKANHEQIGRCVAAARQGLSSLVDRIAISRDSHYQLSNRVASAWKLASLGLPVALLYLGFTGDTYFRDYLRDADHWQRVVGAYMADVLPLSFPEQPIAIPRGATMRMLIRSLPALKPSTPPSA